MRSFFLTFFCISLYLFSSAQLNVILKGSVIDDSTSLPVEGAFIVCQSTTLGATSDAAGNFSLSIPSGGYTVMVGSTGYETESQRISTVAGQTEILNIRLRKKVKKMEDVVVQASSEVANGWEKYGSHFKEYFLGKSPFAAQSVIENPEVLKFYYSKKKNRLRVKAETPVKIRNEALGYQITYMLDSFVYEYQTQFSLHSGVTLFTEMDSTEQQKNIWKKNREEAYWGSRLHFMRCYYDSTLTENGFLIEEIRKTDSSETYHALANPYDSAFYEPLDSLEKDVYLIGRYRIHYKERPMLRAYLQANKYPLSAKGQLSTLELKNGFVIVENGYFYEQNEVISSGYWAWKNLADQLPYDYWPDESP